MTNSQRVPPMDGQGLKRALPPKPEAPVTLPRRRALALLAGTLCCPSLVHANTFPSRPVRIIVPFVPGGSSDVIARLLAPRLTTLLGQQVIVDNRPGAAGNLAVELTARANPDGHTMMLGAPGALTVNPLLYKDLKFIPLRDLAAVSMVGQLEHAIVVSRNFPATDLNGFIQHARANPGRVTYGSSGVGTTTHLAGAMFAQQAGIKLQHISYRGAGQAMVDLMSGTINAMFDLLPSSISHVRSGSVRVLATTGPTRAAQLPDVPTAIEAGLKGFVATSWHALMAPKETPPNPLAVLSTAVGRALAEPELVERTASLGAEPIPTKPAATTAFLRADAARWVTVIKAAQITLENQ